MISHQIKVIVFFMMITVRFNKKFSIFTTLFSIFFLSFLVDLNKLKQVSRDVAKYSTKLPYLDFSKTASGKADIQLFNFTSMYSAANSSCAKKIYSKCCQKNVKNYSNHSTYCLLMLCGDSLLEPVSYPLFYHIFLILTFFYLSFGQPEVAPDVAFCQQSIQPGWYKCGLRKYHYRIVIQCSTP